MGAHHCVGCCPRNACQCFWESCTTCMLIQAHVNISCEIYLRDNLERNVLHVFDWFPKRDVVMDLNHVQDVSVHPLVVAGRCGCQSGPEFVVAFPTSRFSIHVRRPLPHAKIDKRTWPELEHVMCCQRNSCNALMDETNQWQLIAMVAHRRQKFWQCSHFCPIRYYQAAQKI